MCGRINVSDNEGVRLLLAMLGMEVWPSRDPRFNIAPSQTLDVVTWQDDSPSHEAMKWGLIPSWAKPGTFSAPLINARSETVHDKPSFKKLVAQHRALIPINGFYEWQRDGKAKVPYFIKPADANAMFLAALYQPAPPPAGDQPTSYPQTCVVTVAANESMSQVHHRMPVILAPDQALAWIQPTERNVIDQLMQPASNETLTINEVGDYVNSARNEGPECIAPKRVNDLFD